jgi:hypothetical protein
MKRFFRSAMILATSKLGLCPTCMRISFRAALLSWLFAAAVLIAVRQNQVDLAALLATAGFTVLWFAHLLAFSLRSIRTRARRIAADGTATPALLLRRKFLSAFAQTFFFAAIATIVPMSVARADGCNCFTENNCSCPSDAPNCFFNPSTGVGYCCATSVGCGNSQGEWCCPNQCGGDTGTCLG